MALIVLLSPGGAPGVTTTALALTLAWPGKAVLAECDRSGGAVLAGLWGGTVPADQRGLLHLALQVRQQPGRQTGAAVCCTSSPTTRQPGAMIVAAIAGACAGLGLAVVIIAFRPAPPRLGAIFARLDGTAPVPAGRPTAFVTGS
jgi:hypothetical protein